MCKLYRTSLVLPICGQHRQVKVVNLTGFTVLFIYIYLFIYLFIYLCICIYKTRLASNEIF